eukprot:2265645-Karenia_brevis.AAC.1
MMINLMMTNISRACHDPYFALVSVTNHEHPAIPPRHHLRSLALWGGPTLCTSSRPTVWPAIGTPHQRDVFDSSTPQL